MTRIDDPQDAYLKQALRHAPDADAAPPAQLSEAILRAARSAATPPRPAPPASAPPTALQALWNWIAQPRVATGFASLMVATLVGVMWWGEPIESMQGRPADPAREASAPAARDALPAPVPTPSAPVVDPAAPAAAVAGPVLMAKSMGPEAAAGTVRELRSLDASRRKAAPPGTDRSMAQAPAPRVAPEQADAVARSEPAPPAAAAAPLKERAEATAAARNEAEVRADAAQPAPTTPAAAPPTESVAMAPPAPPAEPTPAPPTAVAAAPAAPVAAAAAAAAARAEAETAADAQTNAARSLERSRPAQGKTTTAMRADGSLGLSGRAQAAQDLALGLAAAPRSPLSPLSRLHAEVAAAPARWQWRLDDGAPRAADAALLDWLVRADRAVAAGRARPSGGANATTAARDGADTASTRTLMLLLDGQPHRAVRLSAGRLLLTTGEGRLQQLDVALEPAVEDDLRRTIDALAR